jgi:predicted GNAT family N-acyltransferase
MTFHVARSQDLAACLRIRHEVFVVEQNVPIEEERDSHDDTDAIHFLATKDGHPIGAARIIVVADAAKIGRVCVAKSERGTGMGVALINACLATARDIPTVTKAKLGAQIDAIGFYEKLGFTAFGPVYMDAGIEHRDMALDL